MTNPPTQPPSSGNDPLAVLISQAQIALDAGQGEYLVPQLAQALLIDENRVSAIYQRALIQRAYQRTQRNDLTGAMTDYQEAYRYATPGQQQQGLQSLIDQLNDRIANAQASTVQAPATIPAQQPPSIGYTPTQPAATGRAIPGQAGASPYQCPNCGQGVPATANNCPACGAVLTPTQQSWANQPTVKSPGQGSNIWFLAGILFLLVMAIGGYFIWRNMNPPSSEATETIESTTAPTLPAVESIDVSSTETAAWVTGDDDGDGLNNAEETASGTDPLSADTDLDGLSDPQEIKIGANPLDNDSDDDGLTDGDERSIGTDPLILDTDGDGCYDGQETGMRTDPLNPDSDGDGLSDCSDPDPLKPPTPTKPAQLGLIAFQAGPGQGKVNDIFTMNADGSGITQVTTGSRDDRVPAWSPDGRKIAYQSNADGDYELMIMDLSSRQTRQITFNNCVDDAPAWSPDGTRLAYYSDCDSNREIYTIGVDGSNPRQLTFTENIWNLFPSWTPDGNIIFSSNREGGKYWIYIMDTNGNIKSKLTQGCVATYSPDGSQIVYAEFCFDDSNIYVMDANGTNQRVIDEVYFGRNPAWSSDGNKIVLQSKRSGKFEIWTIDITTLEWTQLTNMTDLAAAPVWQPVSNR